MSRAERQAARWARQARSRANPPADALQMLGSPHHHHQNRPRRATSSSRSKTSGARPTRRQRKLRSRRTCAARPATCGGCWKTRSGPTLRDLVTDTRRSYAETRARAARVGGWLRLHLTAGDRVALVAPNSLFAFEAHYACAFGGLTLLNCNPRLAPSELKWCLEHAGCKVLIVDGVYRDRRSSAQVIK